MSDLSGTAVVATAEGVDSAMKGSAWRCRKGAAESQLLRLALRRWCRWSVQGPPPTKIPRTWASGYRTWRSCPTPRRAYASLSANATSPAYRSGGRRAGGGGRGGTLPDPLEQRRPALGRALARPDRSRPGRLAAAAGGPAPPGRGVAGGRSGRV